MQRLDDVKTHESVSEAQAACYDRNHPRYPYKSHGQWLRASFGMAACIIIFFFSGVFSFLVEPFDYQNFLVSYISVSSPCVFSTKYMLSTYSHRVLYLYSLWWDTKSISMGLEYQNGAQRDPATLADAFKSRATIGRVG